LGRRSAALLFALATAGPAISAEQTPSPGEAAIAQLRQTAMSGPRCSEAHDTLAYVGPTDGGLIACLNARPRAKRLQITSLGGPVSQAIEAARIVGKRKMDVSVAGFCGSSCGNYIIAAAARLDVLPDSVVMLHGAPLAGPAAQRAQAIDALEEAGIPEDQLTSAILDQAVAQLQAQRALHDAFAADFAVGNEWYDLTAYYRALQGQPGGPMLLVSPEFARACLHHPRIGTFWYPATGDERERIRQMLGGQAMFMGADLPTPTTCAS
jgi:hypothetical protein